MSANSKKSVWEAGLIYGVMLGAVSVISSVIFYVLGKSMSDLEKYVTMGLMLILLCYFLYMYREEYKGGFITYGQVVGAGVIITTVMGIIGAVYLIILVKWIDPSIQNLIDEKSLDKMLEQMAKRNIYPSQSEIDAMMENTKWMRSTLFLGIAAVLNSAIMGTVISAIAGIFIKKQSPDPFAGIEEQGQ